MRLKLLIVSGTVLEGFGKILGRFWEGFGRTFEEIRHDFGSYLEGVEELTSMIRATRGRSIDR